MSQLKKFFLHVIVYLVVFIAVFKVLKMESSFLPIFLASLTASFLIVLVEKCISKFEEK